MDDDRLDSAARVAAVSMHREYGKFCMERLVSGDQQDPGSDSWQDYVRRVVCYASSPHAHGQTDGRAELEHSSANDSAGAIGSWDNDATNQETLHFQNDEMECVAPHLVDGWLSGILRSTGEVSPAFPAILPCADDRMALGPESAPPAPYKQPKSQANSLDFPASTLDPKELQSALLSPSTSPRCSSIESTTQAPPTSPSLGTEVELRVSGGPSTMRYQSDSQTASCNDGEESATIQFSHSKRAPTKHRSGQESNRGQAARIGKIRRVRAVAVRGTNTSVPSLRSVNPVSAKATDGSFRAQMFVDGMGKLESLVHLRDILSQAREPEIRRAVRRSAQTFAETFLTLESREEVISFTILQQFQDAMVLYERLRQETSQQSSDQFQLVTPESFDRPGPRRLGNRRNLQKFDISTSLLHQIAPDVLVSSPEYEKKRAKAKEFCECGRRLALMAERFGRASTCLALVASDFERQITSWRRHILFTVSQSELDLLLAQLDSTRGEFLRSLSQGLHGVLDFVQDPTRSGERMTFLSIQVDSLTRKGQKE